MMLVKWGCDVAQRNNVEAFLESSPAGLRLYRQCGFQEVDRFVMDLEKYGGEGSRFNAQMMKYPENTSKASTGMDIQSQQHPQA